MRVARFRFYAHLNGFLPWRFRGREIALSFWVPPSVKDAIERLGVPHTEVDLILSNGSPVPFTEPLADGARVSVYPAFHSIDISSISRVRPLPLARIRFALDVHLGRLAAYLRMLGFDALYRSEWPDFELAATAAQESRILLTRDAGLLKRSAILHGYYVRETRARLQLIEVLRRFDLAPAASPFTRCLRCNEPLTPAPREEVIGLVPERTAQAYTEFQRCPTCARIYWKGPHYERMRRFIDETL